MYTFMSLVTIAMMLMLAPMLLGSPPVIAGLFERAERLRFRGYLSVLVFCPLIITAATYALATITGVVFGYANAWADTGKFFAMVFLILISGCVFRVLGEVGSIGRSVATGKSLKGAPGVSVLTSLIFMSSMYGTLAVLLFKIEGIVTF